MMKKWWKNCHLGTIAQLCRAISSQLRHVSTIRKKLVKQQYLPHMSLQYGELRPTSGWDGFVSWGTPANFNGFSRLRSVTARHSSSGRQPKCGVEQRAPPIFGRATITLGIGPHSSCLLYVEVSQSLGLHVLEKLLHWQCFSVLSKLSVCDLYHLYVWNAQRDWMTDTAATLTRTLPTFTYFYLLNASLNTNRKSNRTIKYAIRYRSPVQCRRNHHVWICTYWEWQTISEWLTIALNLINYS